MKSWFYLSLRERGIYEVQVCQVIAFIFAFFVGSNGQTDEFIKLRGRREGLFTGAKNSAAVGWR